jgi:hypothetical protein
VTGAVRLLAIFTVIAVAAVFASPVLAKRPPTPTERSAIRAAMAAFIEMPGSPAASDNRVTRIRVSTVNARFASAATNSPTAGPAVAILKKRGSTWKVISFGSDTPCSAAPRNALIDLLGECASA